MGCTPAPPPVKIIISWGCWDSLQTLMFCLSFCLRTAEGFGAPLVFSNRDSYQMTLKSKGNGERSLNSKYLQFDLIFKSLILITAPVHKHKMSPWSLLHCDVKLYSMIVDITRKYMWFETFCGSWNRVSWHSPYWPQTQNPLSSASQMLGLQPFSTKTSSKQTNKSNYIIIWRITTRANYWFK